MTLVVEASIVVTSLIVGVPTLVVLFALFDVAVARSERNRLRSVRREPAVASAVSEILLARDNFARVVSRYETTVAAQSRIMSRATDGASDAPGLAADPIGGFYEDGRLSEIHPELELDIESPEIQALVIEKDRARQRLLDAQRLWDMVRPGAGPAAACQIWFGSGIMRSWQLGPIGFERMYFRFEHAVDSSCWSVFEARRLRFGFGLGAERLSLAMFAAGAAGQDLDDLSGLALGGPECGLRPGFVPTRAWRRLRRSPEAKAANNALLSQRRVSELVHGLSVQQRSAAVKAFEAELGERLTPTTVLPPGPALISVSTKGPSLMVGAWFGRTPNPIIRASSDHGAWQQRG